MAFKILGSNIIDDTRNIINALAVGIGTVTPRSKLDVEGDVVATGIATANRFSSLVATGTAPISVASSTRVNNLNVELLNGQPSIYYQIANNLTGTAPGSVITQSSGLTVTGNLSVSGNVTIGGTTTQLTAQQLIISDRDIVVGYTTDANGNDVSTDITANHGGISVASTVGSPLITIPQQAGINSNPASYKQWMWIRQNNYSGLGTDAWVSNYAVSIANTASVQLNSRLTVGAGFTVYDTYLDAQGLRATSLDSSSANISGLGTVTTLRGTNINYTGVGTIASFNATTSTITNENGTNINFSGIGTVANLGGTNINYTGIGTIATFNATTASVSNATGSNINYTGIGTVANLGGTNINYTGVGTIASFNATTSTITNENGTNLNFSGLGTVTTLRGTNINYTGVGTIATLNATTSTITNETGTNINFSGIGTIATLNSTVATLTNLGGTNVNYTGVGTIATLNSTVATLTNLGGTNVNYTGVGTIATLNSTVATLTNLGGTNVNYTGVGTIANLVGTNANYTGIITAASFSGSGANLTGVVANSTVSTSSTTATQYIGFVTVTSGISTSIAVSTGLAFIPSSGNLGIGSLTPTSKLHVEGSALITGVGTIATLNSTVATLTNLGGTNVNYTGIGTIATLNSTVATLTNLGGTNVNYTGIGTIATLNSTVATLTNLGGTNVNYTGIGTIATFNATRSTITNETGTNLNFSGIATAATYFVGATKVLDTVNSQISITGIQTIDATTRATLERELSFAPNSFTDLQVGGISTFSNGPVLIGGGTSTGTLQQAFQVGSATSVLNAYISGNLGLGSTTPAAKLDVIGGVKITGALTDNNGSTGSNNFVLTAGTGGQLVWGSVTSTGAISGISVAQDDVGIRYPLFATGSGSITSAGIDTSSLVYNSNTNRLGIGSTNPQTTLDVIGGVKITGSLTDNNGSTGSNNFVLTAGTGGQLVWSTVTSTGAISGVTISEDNAGIRYPLLGAGAGSTSTEYIDSSSLVFNTSTNNLGIGSLTPTSRLDIIGDVKVAGIITATDFNSSSDRTLKDNIQVIPNPIEKVLQLNGVSFSWKATGESSMGVIAQEVEKVLPELVSNTDPKSVNYNGLIGLLIECVKNQQSQIDELKNKKRRTK